MAEETQPKTRSYTAYLDDETKNISLFRYMGHRISEPAPQASLSPAAEMDVLDLMADFGTRATSGKGTNLRIYVFEDDVKRYNSGDELIQVVHRSNRQFDQA